MVSGFMYKKQILKTLHENKGEYVQGDELASEMGISESQLTSEIQELGENGYEIKLSTENGYCLIKTPNRLLPYELERDLPTRYIGKEIHYYSEVDSTNEVAKRLAHDGAPEGTILLQKVNEVAEASWQKMVITLGGVWIPLSET
jgi:BirA family biotin operon repressor/biotin-[acetyl-CoA-carboxylase] ligase